MRATVKMASDFKTWWEKKRLISKLVRHAHQHMWSYETCLFELIWNWICSLVAIHVLNLFRFQISVLNLLCSFNHSSQVQTLWPYYGGKSLSISGHSMATTNRLSFNRKLFQQEGEYWRQVNYTRLVVLTGSQVFEKRDETVVNILKYWLFKLPTDTTCWKRSGDVLSVVEVKPWKAWILWVPDFRVPEQWRVASAFIFQAPYIVSLIKWFYSFIHQVVLKR